MHIIDIRIQVALLEKRNDSSEKCYLYVAKKSAPEQVLKRRYILEDRIQGGKVANWKILPWTLSRQLLNEGHISRLYISVTSFLIIKV